MSISENSTVLTPSSSDSGAEVDPLLKDLNEKKQSFRRNMVSLAAELKQTRVRLTSQEQSFAKETLTRQEAEKRAKSMEKEICLLEKRLEERDGQLQASAAAAAKYLEELDELRTQLASTKAIADASASSAQNAQLQCSTLFKELEEKTSSLRAHEDRVLRMGEQLYNLQQDLKARDLSQKQLQDEVLRIEHDIMQAVLQTGATKDVELQKMLVDISPKNYDKISRLLTTKDGEITKLKDDIRIMSAHWKHKTKELETQLEKQRRADQELKKKVLKLEFCLQDARSQTRKLQRMGEKRDKAIKELKDQLNGKEQNTAQWKKNFWETSGFKIFVSMSMLVLVVASKR